MTCDFKAISWFFINLELDLKYNILKLIWSNTYIIAWKLLKMLTKVDFSYI